MHNYIVFQTQQQAAVIIEISLSLSHPCININLNNNSVINLEMQVINEHNWPERSLSYLCRNYDNLNKGMNYQDVKSSIQIGLPDFTLFPEHPEFYATYQFLNVKTFTKYSDDLRLSVLDLSQIQLATKEDKSWQLDHWAALFKSTTWEEIKMLAQNDKYISEASETIYQLTQEERIRLQCEAREDFIRRQRSNEARTKQLVATIEEKDANIAELTATIEEQTATIADKDAIIEVLKAQMAANGIPIDMPKK